MSKKPQQQMEMVPVTHQVIDGLEMGVLGDGTPYLTARALARLCDVAPSVIITLGSRWDSERHKPRGRKIQRVLTQQGYASDEIVIKTHNAGVEVSAHPDAVCMAVLEYYAFEKNNSLALQAYRLLARQSLRQFIYGRLGYDPTKAIPEAWRQYHDRMTLNASPQGYFSVFREISNIIITGIQGGMSIDARTMPDISVGMMWGKHWRATDQESEHGERIRHDHNFPEYFPQKSTVEAWVYPLEALGEFRIWLQREYLPKKFPGYLKSKAAKGVLPVSSVELILSSMPTKELPPGKD